MQVSSNKYVLHMIVYIVGPQQLPQFEKDSLFTIVILLVLNSVLSR
jgi:hypothetical protein